MVRLCAAIVSALILAGAAATDSGGRPRFFFAGDGLLTVVDGHSGTNVRAQFRRRDGSYDANALAQLTRFLRSRGDDREGEISLRLLEQLDYLEDLARPRQLRLASGFRSSDYNAAVRTRGGRAAAASLHTQGLAADLQFIGVNTRTLWQRIRALGCCGVGYYNEGNFLHVDVGPPRFWEAATSKVDQNLSGGNARIFARTDFDRYQSLAGALVRLHSLTAFPLRVAARAEAIAGEQRGTVRLGAEGDVQSEGECLVITGGERHLLRVTAAEAIALDRRARLRLTTCEPRIERTPEQFESNEFEVSHQRARLGHDDLDTGRGSGRGQGGGELPRR